jgi:hypothetical protein
MTKEKLQLLRDELVVLSSDAESQLEHLRSTGFSECIDELALDYDAIAAAAGDMLQRGEINADQRECVSELNSLLSMMSGQANAHLWTPEALRSSEKWKEVRTKASECLRLF